MRYLTAACILLLLCGASVAQAGTRSGQLRLYAERYGAYQEWVLTDTARTGLDNRRARFRLTYLANPAPGAGGCFAAVVYVDSCPEKWWAGGFPFYMRVEARVVKCGPTWFVVSTPLDSHDCGFRLPSWPGT